MTKPSWKFVCQPADGLTLTALAAQSMGHALDGAQRVPSRDLRSHVGPSRQGD